MARIVTQDCKAPYRATTAICAHADIKWCRGTESNCRHQPFQGCALPTELPRHGRYLNNLLPAVSRRAGTRASMQNGLNPVWLPTSSDIFLHV